MMYFKRTSRPKRAKVTFGRNYEWPVNPVIYPLSGRTKGETYCPPPACARGEPFWKFASDAKALPGLCAVFTVLAIVLLSFAYGLFRYFCPVPGL